jgi:hypothetical protein
MKNLILISALVLSVVSTVFSQTVNDKVFDGVNLESPKINNKLLQGLIFEKFNKYINHLGLPNLTHDNATYKAARYQSRFVNKYLKYRLFSNDNEPVDGLVLKTRQDRLDYYSDVEGVGRRKGKNMFYEYCINASLSDKFYMTYDEISEIFVNGYFDKASELNFDIIKILSDSKYVGVSVDFDIEGGETIVGSGIYKLTITIVTSTDASESL